MASSVRYLLDSDVLITAKNLHYNPNFCGAFWKWVAKGHTDQRLFSIDRVRDELLTGKDDDVLHGWAQSASLDGFFLDSKKTAQKWQDLAQWAINKKPQFLPAAVTKFLDVKSADAWLIAYAASHPNFVIVTNEQPAPESKRSIKLPDAAAAVGVKTVSLFDVLGKHAKSDFVFHG